MSVTCTIMVISKCPEDTSVTLYLIFYPCVAGKGE